MSIWTNVAPKNTSARSPEDVLIIGSGPAGYTAALYAARANLEPLVIEGLSPGGLLQGTELVENFPGYPNGVLGPQLVADLRVQAERFGARFIEEEAIRIESRASARLHRVATTEREVAARALILAMGAAPRKLDVPGEEDLGAGRGVAYCAVCEAPLFAGRRTLVVGGGDSAMEEALALARHARSVTLLHRRPEFRASAIMRERVMQSDRIEIMTPYVVDALLAGPEGKLQRARLRHTETGASRDLDVDGAFVAIGHEPRSELVRDWLKTDRRGYVVCHLPERATSMPGVFACGELVDHRYRQAITAAASGCEAALDAQRYLEGIGRG